VTRPILVVGSVNLDVVCPVDQIPRPGQTVMGQDVQLFHGGKGANQAMGIARLGYPVRMVGRVGDDAAGARLRAGLRAGGVDVRRIATTRGTPSGMALICTDRRGENSIVVSPGANARLTPRDVQPLAALLRSCAMLLLQLEIPLETVDRVTVLAQRAGVPVMLDPAPARDLPASLLRRITWLTPNESEAAYLCGGTAATTMTRRTAVAHAEALRARGCGTAIVTRGRHGCCIAAGARPYAVPAFHVRAIDSTAAGDAFNAGLAVALVRGDPLADAVRYASAVAAVSVTRAGAQPSMPTARDVRRFLRQRGGARRARRAATAHASYAPAD
jgi:ribokinase